jgi:hypothetical protein
VTRRIPQTWLAVLALFIATACNGDSSTAPEVHDSTFPSEGLGDLVARFNDAAHTCRGGFGDVIGTWRACKDRDKLRGEIVRNLASGLTT